MAITQTMKVERTMSSDIYTQTMQLKIKMVQSKLGIRSAKAVI
jgi:hypothetical protein